MPLNIPKDLPAVKLLQDENIFVKTTEEASTQEIRPLKIVILNLMPIKITTETDLVRLLSNTPLQLEIDLMQLESHQSTHTPVEHMLAFYKKFSELKHHKYDGMIITGAPLENYEYEEVTYWEEMKTIFDWAKTHVQSTLYICWAAQAGLYYYYGIPKYPLEKKKFGIFPQRVIQPQLPIFRGFDDFFYMPHSRHTEIRREDIDASEYLSVLAEGEESGVSMVVARGGREFFVTGHLEYAPNTLDKEYRRDIGKRDDVELPKYYYRDDNPDKGPIVKWRAHANLFFQNWVNYYVYQQTPYDINLIG